MKVEGASFAAAMAAAVWDLQRCTFCCSCGSLASTTAGYSRFELSDVAGESLRSAFPGGGLPTLALRKSRGGKQFRTGAVTRSLYSPLVASFGTAKGKLSSDLNIESDRNDSGAWRTSSPTDSPIHHQEQAGEDVNEVEENDSSRAAAQDPLTAAYGDGAHAEKLADIGHDVDMKRGARGRARARARPPSMSLSQGFSSVGRRAVSHTVGAVGHPLSNSKVPGPIGFVMAFAVAVLGVKTAVEKQGLLPGTPQKICEKCDGYGVQQCHVCRGRGVLTWEGKLLHKDDPCPLCFERCVEKCSSCGGVKVKKGLPPTMAASTRK